MASQQMAGGTTAVANPKSLPKISILEEDDEFEDFPMEDWNESEEIKIRVDQWEADWDDDNIQDEFTFQLRYPK